LSAGVNAPSGFGSLDDQYWQLCPQPAKADTSPKGAASRFDQLDKVWNAGSNQLWMVFTRPSAAIVPGLSRLSLLPFPHHRLRI
jgi:hypothetical protein